MKLGVCSCTHKHPHTPTLRDYPTTPCTFPETASSEWTTAGIGLPAMTRVPVRVRSRGVCVLSADIDKIGLSPRSQPRSGGSGVNDPF